jgi:hypothetical protein
MREMRASSTKKHLAWLCERLGPWPMRIHHLLAKGDELSNEPLDTTSSQAADVRTIDFTRILRPKCKCEFECPAVTSCRLTSNYCSPALARPERS